MEEGATTAPPAPGTLIHRGRDIAFDAAANARPAAGAPGADAAAGTTTAAAEFRRVDLTWANLTFDVPRKASVVKEKTNKAKDDDGNKNANGAAGSKRTGKGLLARAGLKKQQVHQQDDTRDAAAAAGAHSAAQPASPTVPKDDAGDGDDDHDAAAATVPDMSADAAATGGLRRVLHGVNGTVRAGQFLAIMGASGAGKSTLLNLLAGRVQSSKGCVTGGSVLLNGKRRNFDEFNKLACYVEQEDTMFAELTVQEQITYSALLRLPGRMTRERKLLRVESVIQELGLSKARNTVIGDELVKGVSGGERKRVSIATELVTDASLLFLDEPTTGLDAFNALNVMNSLRHLASNGRTVVSTIHQPRSSIFHLFDLLCVLSEGRTVFFGPAKNASAYFASLGFRAPPHFNIADYVIDAVSIDYRSKKLEANTKHRVLYLAKEYNAAAGSATSPHLADTAAHAEEVVAEAGDGVAAKKSSRTHVTYPNNFVAEFMILLSRALKKLSRENVTNITRTSQTIFFGILLGIIWVNRGRHLDSAEDRFSTLGVIFFLAVNQGFDGAFSVIFDFVIERAVITRERTAAAYRTTTYFVSNLLVGVFKIFIVNIVFVTLVYWMVGLRPKATAFFFTILTTMTLGLTGEGFSQAISVFTGSAQIAAAIVPLVVVLAFLFAGFFIAADAMPGVVRWGQNLSFLYWGYNALAKNEFAGRGDAISERVLGGLNEYSRWENYGFVLLFAAFAKLLFLLALFVRRPKYDKTL